MNYLQFVNTVLETAKSHKLVHEVGEGDIYEHLNSGDHKYPCVFLTVQNVESNGTQMTVTGSLFYVDVLLSDNSNKLQIQSTGLSTLQQIFMRLMENYPDFDLRTGRYTPFDEKFSDLCAGMFSNFTISFVDDTCIVNDDIFEEDKPEPEPTIKDYLCFTALEDDVELTLFRFGDASTFYQPTLEYSRDGKEFTEYHIQQWIHLNKKGDKIYFRGDNPTISTSSKNKFFYFYSEDFQAFSVTGNIMSLLSSDLSNTDTIEHECCFYGLFINNDAFKEFDIKLPATVLSKQCYERMFNECMAVEKFKMTLPAITLSERCYSQMFNTNGVHFDIDVTILAEDTSTQNCMYKMFGPDDIDVSGTIYKKRNTVIPDNCYIPDGVTVVDI